MIDPRVLVVSARTRCANRQSSRH